MYKATFDFGAPFVQLEGGMVYQSSFCQNNSRNPMRYMPTHQSLDWHGSPQGDAFLRIMENVIIPCGAISYRWFTNVAGVTSEAPVPVPLRGYRPVTRPYDPSYDAARYRKPIHAYLQRHLGKPGARERHVKHVSFRGRFAPATSLPNGLFKAWVDGAPFDGEVYEGLPLRYLRHPTSNRVWGLPNRLTYRWGMVPHGVEAPGPNVPVGRRIRGILLGDFADEVLKPLLAGHHYSGGIGPYGAGAESKAWTVSSTLKLNAYHLSHSFTEPSTFEYDYISTRSRNSGRFRREAWRVKVAYYFEPVYTGSNWQPGIQPTYIAGNGWIPHMIYSWSPHPTVSNLAKGDTGLPYDVPAVAGSIDMGTTPSGWNCDGSGRLYACAASNIVQVVGDASLASIRSDIDPYRDAFISILGDLQPTHFYSSQDAFRRFSDDRSLNLIEPLTEMSEVLSAFGLFDNVQIWSELLTALRRKKLLTASVRFVDLVTSLNLTNAFGIQPTLQLLSELDTIVGRVNTLIKSLDGRRYKRAYGQFKYDLPMESLPEALKRFESGYVVTRSQLRVRVDPESLLASYMTSRVLGITPSLSSVYEAVPMSFVLDWFTGLGTRLRDTEDQAALLVLDILYCIHSYTIMMKWGDGMHQRYNTRGIGDTYTRYYIRDVSRYTPTLGGRTRFDFRESRLPSVGIAGSLAWLRL